MPAVDSVVICLKRKVDVYPDKNFKQLFAFIEAAFLHRRKTLANSLAASAYGMDSVYWQDIIERCYLDKQTRAEALKLSDFESIYQKYKLIRQNN